MSKDQASLAIKEMMGEFDLTRSGDVSYCGGFIQRVREVMAPFDAPARVEILTAEKEDENSLFYDATDAFPEALLAALLEGIDGKGINDVFNVGARRFYSHEDRMLHLQEKDRTGVLVEILPQFSDENGHYFPEGEWGDDGKEQEEKSTPEIVLFLDDVMMFAAKSFKACLDMLDEEEYLSYWAEPRGSSGNGLQYDHALRRDHKDVLWDLCKKLTPDDRYDLLCRKGCHGYPLPGFVEEQDLALSLLDGMTQQQRASLLLLGGFIHKAAEKGGENFVKQLMSGLSRDCKEILALHPNAEGQTVFGIVSNQKRKDMFNIKRADPEVIRAAVEKLLDQQGVGGNPREDRNS